MLPWEMLLLLLACSAPDDDSALLGADAPARCVEVAREPVTDPAVPAPGMAWAPGPTLSDAVGSFAGTLDAGGGAALALSLALAGDAEWVDLELEGGGGDSGPATGAPEPACDDAYEARLAGRFTADPLVDLPLAVSVTLAAEGEATWSARTDLDAVGGSGAPADIDPADWDEVVLGLDARLDAGGWSGSATWSASNAAAKGRAKDQADTGAVGVAGAVEPWGSWTAR